MAICLDNGLRGPTSNLFHGQQFLTVPEYEQPAVFEPAGPLFMYFYIRDRATSNTSSPVDFLTNGNAEVAELFAGTGQLSNAFARLGAEIVATGEVDEDAQDMLRHKHPRAIDAMSGRPPEGPPPDIEQDA